MLVRLASRTFLKCVFWKPIALTFRGYFLIDFFYIPLGCGVDDLCLCVGKIEGS